MANIANLSVSLSARIGKFQKNFAKARRTVNNFSRDVTRSLKSLGGAGVLLGGVLAGAGLTTLVSQQLQAIDSTAKFADSIGFSTEALTGYQLAAKITGVEQKALNTGLARFQKNIGDARRGLSTATDAFDDLGLSYKDIINLSPDQQLKVVADRFSQVGNQAVRTNVLLNLFGRSGLAIGKLLQQGSKGIEAFQKENEKLGGSFSRLDAAKVEEANDALARMRVLITGVAKNIAVQLAPFITVIANRFVEAQTAGDNMGRFITNAISNISSRIGIAIDLVELLKGSWQGFRGVVELVAGTIIESFNIIGKSITNLINLIPGVNIQFTKFGDDLVNRFSVAAETSFKKAGDSLTAFANNTNSRKFENFYNEVQKQAEQVAKKSTEALSLPGVQLASEITDKNKKKNKTRTAEFQQIDLSRIVVGGLQGGKKDNTVNAPQLNTTNNILQKILTKTGNGQAVAA